MNHLGVPPVRSTGLQPNAYLPPDVEPHFCMQVDVMARKLKVLIVDDSPISRQMFAHALSKDPQIDVVATAEDAYEARDLIVKHRPDVMTLDIDMPRMDGAVFLQKLMPRMPLPVVMVTGSRSPLVAKALDAGAVDVVFKPGVQPEKTMQDTLTELRTKVKLAASRNVSEWKRRHTHVPQLGHERSLIALGASTGGTDALEEIVSHLPPGCPPVLIVQHMLHSFTRTFAKRLNQRSPLIVREATHNEPLQHSTVLVAPGGQHLAVVASDNGYTAHLSTNTAATDHCPSVDILMHSVAHAAGEHGIGVLLTGMGDDGAEGLLSMRHAGAHTLVQDEASCVVYGMPRAAWTRGAARQQCALHAIPSTLVQILNTVQ